MRYDLAVTSHFTTFEGSVTDAIRSAIGAALPDATIEVTGQGGHYVIGVVSGTFAGKSTLERHRVVYAAIAHLMQGDGAPVHAVDSLSTRTPG